MFLSKHTNGYYYLWLYDESGKRKKISTKSKLKSEAVNFLRKFDLASIQKRNTITLSNFAAEYLSYSSTVHARMTQREIKLAFTEFIRIEGNLLLSKTNNRNVEHFIRVKSSEASVWSARKYYTALRASFTRAIKWNYISHNPFKDVEKPRPPEVLPSYFTLGQFTTLINCVRNPLFRTICMTAAMTGLRLNEILHIELKNIDWERRTIGIINTVEFRTKNRKNRVIPINQGLLVILKSFIGTNTDRKYLFDNRGACFNSGYISRKFKNYVRKAGLPETLHFHSLRHTFASWLVQDGVSLYEVKELLGHSSISVTEIYSHLQPQTLHNTVNRIKLEFDSSELGIGNQN